MPTHRFIIRGGQTIVDGKSNYPDLLRLRMDKSSGWSFATQVLKQIELGHPIEIDLLGQLTEESDE